MFPKPARSGGPPILIAGRSPAALARAARGGHSWIPSAVTPEEVSSGITRLRELHAGFGTHFTGQVVVNLFTRLEDTAARATFPQAIKNVHGKALNERTLMGNPEEVIHRVGEYAEAGVTTLDLKPIYHNINDLIAMMTRFADQVMPAC